jgi:hypothetical protein
MQPEHLTFIYAFNDESDCNKHLEELPDDTLIMSFTIPGRPSTKKTSQRVVRRGGFTKILPSLLYEKYENHCKSYCESFWKNLGYDPIDFGISIKLKVSLDSWIVGDECGYQQANGDIIQKHGIISDDMWIHWADNGNHMIHYDKENPRIEVEIKRFKHPKEAYRNEKNEKEAIKEAKKKAKTKKE